MPLDRADLPTPMQLEQRSPTSFVAPAESYLGERLVIYGGALLAQSIAAVGLASEDDKEVEAVQLLLVRPGDATQPVEYEVEPLATGRAVSTATVTARQDDRVLSRAQLLLTVDEEHFIRHMNKVAPDTRPPADTGDAEVGIMFPGATSSAADDYGEGLDLRDVHPAQRSIWMGYDDAVPPLVAQAIVGWGSFGVLGPLNMLHQEGISTYDSHRTIMGAILTHSVHFLDRFDLADHVLLALEGTWAGRGRMHGQGSAFGRDGDLVATFTNDALFKPFADGRDRSADTNTIL